MKAVDYHLYLSESRETETLPLGFLFLCPLVNLQAKPPTWFRLPDCVAYWSLHSSGAEALSAEEANHHGFPDIEVRMDLLVRSWDDGVYTGICQFQEAKGFDPSST